MKSHRKARKGRNPQTGEELQIPAKTVVKFRVAKACKDAVVPPKNGRREAHLFRTVEEFWLDEGGKVVIPDDDTKGSAYECRVTRFMPSRE